MRPSRLTNVAALMGNGPALLMNVSQGTELYQLAQSPSGAKTRCKGKAMITIVYENDGVQFAFGGKYMQTGGELNSNGDITIRKFAVENVATGITTPVLFGGAAGVVVPIGATELLTDKTAAPLPVGDYNLRIEYDGGSGWVSGLNVANTGDQAFLYDPLNEIDDIYSTGTMATPSGASVQTTRSFLYLPYKIIGNAAAGKMSVFVGCDSIGTSRNDLVTLKGNDGTFIRRALKHMGVAYIGGSIVGRTVAGFVAGHALFNAGSRHSTDAFTDLGTNDVAASATFATVMANKRTEWAAYQSNLIGPKRVWGSKMLPRVTTTDGCTTTGNQTPLAGFVAGGIRDQVNTASLANVGSNGLFAFVDTSTPVELTGDPTKWALRSFASMLAAVATSTATSISVIDAPPVGELLSGDPGGPNNSAGLAIVTNVVGSGPYTVTLSTGFATAQLIGAVVKASPSIDGVHPSPPGHTAMAVPVVAAMSGYVG